jgi:hypothetical protein
MPLTEQSALRKDQSTGNSVRLEHRHFAFIAATIKGMPDHAPSLRAQKASCACAFAAACAKTNPRFDQARFLKACGLE